MSHKGLNSALFVQCARHRELSQCLNSAFSAPRLRFFSMCHRYTDSIGCFLIGRYNFSVRVTKMPYVFMLFIFLPCTHSLSHWGPFSLWFVFLSHKSQWKLQQHLGEHRPSPPPPQDWLRKTPVPLLSAPAD